MICIYTYISDVKSAAVEQLVRAFASHVEGLVFESQQQV